jgi:hypothetical protein
MTGHVLKNKASHVMVVPISIRCHASITLVSSADQVFVAGIGENWIPACAGMTRTMGFDLTPAPYRIVMQ